ncbi:MAG: DUF427 domain-containing protein [Rhodobacteraceae bacterium]|nr:DUF427 domain-containing protein [Paracoccaceae bacterium]
MHPQLMPAREPSAPCSHLHVEPRLIVIEVDGRPIAASDCALRVNRIKDSGPETHDLFMPIADIRHDILRPTNRGRACPRFGLLRYWSLAVDGLVLDRAARSCERPNASYSRLRDHIVFDVNRLMRMTKVRTWLN